jgi:DNA-damage-inducible protein J
MKGLLKMPKTAFVRARLQPDIKEEAESILEAIGLTQSEAIKLFYKQIILLKGLPFQLKIPNITTLRAIKNSIENKDCEVFDNDEDFFSDLGI